jgi:hypothetical protein
LLSQFHEFSCLYPKLSLFVILNDDLVCGGSIATI